MNPKIKELKEQSYIQEIDYNEYNGAGYYVSVFSEEKFAELIIKECLKIGKEIQEQNISNATIEYNLGREMGIEVFMNQIKKEFIWSCMMNDRIKELAEEAGWKFTFPVTGKYSGYDKAIEKFAELLIKECISVVQNRDMGGGDSSDIEIRNCIFDIKNHFGVV